MKLLIEFAESDYETVVELINTACRERLLIEQSVTMQVVERDDIELASKKIRQKQKMERFAVNYGMGDALREKYGSVICDSDMAQLEMRVLADFAKSVLKYGGNES